MDRAYVRLPAELGKVVEISAVAASKRKLNLLPSYAQNVRSDYI